MKHVGRFTITQRQREENPGKVASITNQMNVLHWVTTSIGEKTTAISEKWFDAIADDADIPEYEFIIDEKQAVSCRRLGVVAVVEQMPVDAEPVKAPKKKAKKGKA